jgi:hypothetical protein
VLAGAEVGGNGDGVQSGGGCGRWINTAYGTRAGELRLDCEVVGAPVEDGAVTGRLDIESFR